MEAPSGVFHQMGQVTLTVPSPAGNEATQMWSIPFVERGKQQSNHHHFSRRIIHEVILLIYLQFSQEDSPVILGFVNLSFGACMYPIHLCRKKTGPGTMCLMGLMAIY